MNCIELQQLINRCACAGVIDPNAITTSLPAIAEIINITVEVVQQEDIEALLAITADFTNFPTSDEATLLTVAISEQLMLVDMHLARWFLDALLRDADPELRAEVAMGFQHDVYERPYCCSYSIPD
jgi:hypothetical protein